MASKEYKVAKMAIKALASFEGQSRDETIAELELLSEDIEEQIMDLSEGEKEDSDETTESDVEDLDEEDPDEDLDEEDPDEDLDEA